MMGKVEDSSVATVQISCFNCVKCKSSQLQEYVCKYRPSPFTYLSDKPCERWQPSVKSVRLWLARVGKKCVDL